MWKGADLTVDLNAKFLTLDDCRAHLESKTFCFAPNDYKERYPIWPGQVGIEIEMLPVKEVKGLTKPAIAPLQKGEGSIAQILRGLASSRGWQMEDDLDEAGNKLLLKIILDHGDNITFEPGGQVEFSSNPYPCLSDAVARMQGIQQLLDQEFNGQGIELVQVGINPWYTVDELSLQMPKARYRAMNKFFAKIGPFGQRMMRQTCTVQANLDFGWKEEIMAKRYLVSNYVAPFAAAIFSTSGFVDDKIADRSGFRTWVWRHVDPSRTGIPELSGIAKSLTKSACVDSYLKFALNAQVIFITALDYEVPESSLTFGEWLNRPYKGVSPTQKDLETHLSLLFPEVRPRGFLELRSTDCLPRAWQALPAAFYAGLLYDQQNIDQILELLGPRASELNSLMKSASQGLKDPEIREISRKIAKMAYDGFHRLPPCFRGEGTEKRFSVYIDHFIERGRVPADDLRDLVKKSGDSRLSLEIYRKLDKDWLELVT